MNRYYSFAAITLTVAIILFMMAKLAYGALVKSWNSAQLDELSEQTILRTEVAIDRAIITVMELSGSVQLRCNDKFLSEIRTKVFSVGSLKNIHLIKPNQQCSAFTDLELMPDNSFLQQKRYPAHNPAFTFTLIKYNGWVGLGVARSFHKGGELSAIMSVDNLLFDMLPAALREHASMELTIDDGTLFAKYTPSDWGEKNTKHSEIFSASSGRYPIKARIIVDETKLAAWERDLPTIIPILVGFISLFFGTVTARSVMQPRSFAKDLEDAISEGEIVPVFQPIVSLAEQKVIGCEMLARWHKPDGTQVSPGRFIPVAEMSGLADKLTNSLLVQAGKSLGPVFKENDDLKFTYNVTPEQFLSTEFVPQTIKLFNTIGLPAGQVFVEITERQEIVSLDAAATVSKELAKAGIRVAIDDAGTGHNGLASIQNLGAACLKIDKLFIDEIDREPRTRTLIEMLVKVAREFNMSVVAEGIERAEQAATLQALGIREGQGFLYSRPVPAKDFIVLIENGFNEKKPSLEQDVEIIVNSVDFKKKNVA